MTFDERINRLTERHEALTQSLELLARDIQEMRRDQQAFKDDQRKLQSFVMDIAEGTARLLNVAESHERRLSRLEGTD